ncbi:hypothetical protein A11A3_01837 [Alcanivorax hongdengensis A-11-3]|uniref:DUF2834 domain-containing protein n=1 Tax=Alcanivorax hongdengensis A-11-3 TaxID=1177179 RepID=L0WHF3_9GAMM|nr:DUF2834 domain-containing protein [Alcanivorax hongdengensis]EKF75572.1 hypothetical protein A11A3_01837 [Alcanivorax hongdengensis A-11-3]
MMTRNEKILCGVYGAIAAIALVATWTHNLAFMAQPENRGATSFILALYVNHASASIANDILLYCLAGFIFMVHEARRLGIRFVWLYIVLSMGIAVSVMFPLFLIARQVALARQR